jgi:hypothetical protein
MLPRDVKWFKTRSIQLLEKSPLIDGEFSQTYLYADPNLTKNAPAAHVGRGNVVP